MRIILTGPNGFSGNIVLRTLLAQGHQITTISRTPLSADLAGVVTAVYGDLRTISDLHGEHDAIVHIAATSPASDTKSDDLINDNILATANLIKLGKKANINRFIFFSTLSVYGEVTNDVVTEQTPINNPCLYGASKLICEALLRDQSSFKSIAIRLPAVIGKGAARHWLANIVSKCKSNEMISIFNPNANFNNAIHVQDLAGFVRDLLKYDFNKQYDCVNVASLGGLTISNIAHNIKDKLGSASEIHITRSLRKSFIVSTEYVSNNYAFKPMDFTVALTNYLAEC